MRWRLLGGSGAVGGEPVRVVAAVHGMADNWNTWRELAGQLGPGYRCYAVDTPWSGGAGGLLGRWQAPSSGPAAWLRQALAAVPEPVDILLGHSFGANAVLDHLATRREPAVRAAVLLAPLVRPTTSAPYPVLVARTRTAIRQVVGEGLRAKLGTRGASVDADVISSMLDKVFSHVPDQTAHLVLERLMATPRPALRHVDTPTLVLSGRGDQRLAGVRATSLAVMPAVEVRIHEHYDHFCHITQAADVATECAGFLDRVLSALSPAGLIKEVSA
jgi:alpha-beta hydrolase superfamily lysophospholipase